MRRLPPLNFLQAFEAAARHKSFTEAAKELNCTQAAISQRIRGLEAIFGKPLFNRLPSGVQPTEAGEIYVKGIAEALDQLASITRGLSGVRPVRTVSISVPVTFATLWLAPRLKLFSIRYPDINIRLNCTIWNDPHIDSSDFEIQLLGSDRPPPNVECLTRDRAYVVCAPELVAQAHSSANGCFFEHQPLISLVAKYDYWELWRAKMGAARVGNGHRIEVDTGIAAVEIAKHGYGVALSLASYIEPYLVEGSLAKPFADSVDLDLSHFIIRPSDRKLSKAATLFHDFLVEHRSPGPATQPLRHSLSHATVHGVASSAGEV